jgi:hypothetical protein
MADFIEVAKLNDKRKAERIFACLKPTDKNAQGKPEFRLCSKYPFELKDSCLTCWLDYLNNEADVVIEQTFANETELLVVAKQTKGRLGEVIFQALAKADIQVAEALRQMDDKTTGKTNLVDLDYQSIYHAHKERPKFRTTTDNQQDLHEVLKGLTTVIGNQSAPVNNNDAVIQQVAQMMAEQTAQAEAREAKLLAEIEALKGNQNQAIVFNVGDKVTVDGVEAEIIGKPFGKFKVKLANGEEKTVTREQLD